MKRTTNLVLKQLSELIILSLLISAIVAVAVGGVASGILYAKHYKKKQAIKKLSKMIHELKKNHLIEKAKKKVLKETKNLSNEIQELSENASELKQKFQEELQEKIIEGEEKIQEFKDSEEGQNIQETASEIIEETKKDLNSTLARFVLGNKNKNNNSTQKKTEINISKKVHHEKNADIKTEQEKAELEKIEKEKNEIKKNSVSLTKQNEAHTKQVPKGTHNSQLSSIAEQKQNSTRHSPDSVVGFAARKLGKSIAAQLGFEPIVLNVKKKGTFFEVGIITDENEKLTLMVNSAGEILDYKKPQKKKIIQK
jgi:hypothetical protein